ncbi:MAG: phosphoenolpyruvate synthase [Patescibacteria group bacterium]|uniref:Phosphoenolpyruvate synthase n=1 Tax=candidate division WWE3 bacterium TaxID=2053526 RepID=A0A955ED92_UNCKA|nr:phosphoenolpyruvate synthase [candidate division WWE3 bacterium]
MNKATVPILWLSDINKNDIPFVGGKGANLGEMYHSGIPVPNAFCVTSKAYFDFLKETSLSTKILTELSGLDINNTKALQQAATNIQNAILSAQMPPKLIEEIQHSYHKLCGEHDRYVAIRSSATAEDLPDASFAGQQESYLNIKGYSDVVKHVQKCWASLFGARAIFYRSEKKFDHFKVGIAVPVQLMVQSEVSGIMFTVNPVTNNTNEVSIEAAFGLGQPVVSGELTPDQYIYNKNSKNITTKVFARQTWQYTLAGNTPISNAYQEKQKLSDEFIVKLATIGLRVEAHYKHPQDIEWGLEAGKLYIVQSRPVTTLVVNESNKGGVIKKLIDDLKKKSLLEGLGASPGVASGKVQIIKRPAEMDKVREGDILVAEMTNPDFVPAMRRAVAIVTDKGGRTSHAAIVSRELGIPAVVGCVNATSLLSPGELITVDGATGKIFEGDQTQIDKKATEEINSIVGSTPLIKTATKVYMNLAEPDLAQELSKKNIDGVGLLRAEFMIANIGVHPRKFIEDGKEDAFIDALADGLLKFTSAFSPRPVVYRTTDFRTNEYKNLKGGAKYEDEEFNPMIGFRGVSRYLADSEVFRLEIEAIKRVRNKEGFKNLWVMLPFVRTVDQLRDVKKLMASFGLRRSSTFKIWMMVEVPSNVLLLDEFIEEGLDGISIGTNDLTMLVLGVDRDNEKVASVYSELDPAVLSCLEKIVKTSNKHKITSSICGQAPSEYPELVEKLVDWGITSVSLSPDVIDKTRHIIADAEARLIKNRSSKTTSKKKYTK